MFAYLDAATGSMIVSVLAGGAAGLSVVGKTGARRMMGKFKRNSSSSVDNTGEIDVVEASSKAMSVKS